MIKKIVNLILKQNSVGGKWLGGFKQVASGATMYVTFINLALLAVTAYGTTVAPWMQGKGLNIPFAVFFGIIFLVILIVLGFEYKVAVPSNFIFWNDQWWRHDNPIRNKMNNLEKRLNTKIDKSDKRLERIEEALKRIEGQK